MTRESPEERRDRKRSEARDIEATREHLGMPAPLVLSRQAVFHFDRTDQLDALIAAREADPALGFMTRMLLLCTLPKTNPGRARREYRRENGPFRLVMQAGADTGLPFGTVPRLMLAWLCTEVVRLQSRDIHLGHSLSDFMRAVGVAGNSGGRTGSRTRVRSQMDRLFNARVSLTYRARHDHGKVTINSQIADRVELWWSDRHPDQPVMWGSRIRIGEALFDEIRRFPVPLDMHTLRAMSRSPLGLDLYMWLTYRLFSLTAPLRLTWRQLYRQFGANPAQTDKRTVDYFRTHVLRELRKLRIAWPDLSYRTPRGCLELHPTVSQIASTESPTG